MDKDALSLFYIFNNGDEEPLSETSNHPDFQEYPVNSKSGSHQVSYKHNNQGFCENVPLCSSKISEMSFQDDEVQRENERRYYR